MRAASLFLLTAVCFGCASKRNEPAKKSNDTAQLQVQADTLQTKNDSASAMVVDSAVKEIKTNQSPTKPLFKPQFSPGPAALVYKTKRSYNNLVPVMLSDDKKTIVSYPHPKDVTAQSAPTELHSGYLLDNRGIGPNVAFLNMTYVQYAGLKNTPSTEYLFENILDNDPLVEMCNCGNKKAFDNTVEQLNQLIDNNALLTSCKPIK